VCIVDRGSFTVVCWPCFSEEQLKVQLDTDLLASCKEYPVICNVCYCPCKTARIQNPSFHNVLIRALSAYDILPITKVKGLTAIITWNAEEFRAYYNDVTTKPRGTCCSITLIMKLIMTNFLFNCEIRSWSLHFRQFDMSSKYSTKQRISAQYCAKQMSEIWCKNIQAFPRYGNFRVGIFYFASPCIHNIHVVGCTYVCMCVCCECIHVCQILVERDSCCVYVLLCNVWCIIYSQFTVTDRCQNYCNFFNFETVAELSRLTGLL